MGAILKCYCLSSCFIIEIRNLYILDVDILYQIYDLRDYIQVQGLGLEGDLLKSHLECVASFCHVCI